MRESKADTIKIRELAAKYGLRPMEVRNIIKSQFEFVRFKTKSLVFKDGMTREEFDAMKKNFTFPAIGKLYASHFLYNKIQENKNKKKNLEE